MGCEVWIGCHERSALDSNAPKYAFCDLRMQKLEEFEVFMGRWSEANAVV